MIELIVLAGLGGLGAVGATALNVSNAQRRRDRQRTTFRLTFPPTIEAEPVVAFVRTLGALHAGSRASAVFELVGRGGRLEHRVRLDPAVSGDFCRQLAAAAPGVSCLPVPAEPTIEAVHIRELGLRPAHRLLRTDTPSQAAAAILTAMAGAGPKEAVFLQVVVAPDRSGGLARVVNPRAHNRKVRRALPGALGHATVESATPKEVRDKLAEPLFGVTVRIGAAARTNKRAQHLARQVRAVLRVVERPGTHFRRRVRLPLRAGERLAIASTPAFESPAILNAREVGTIIAWPVGLTAPIPGLERTSHRMLAAPSELPQRGRILGTSALPGPARPLAVSAADSLHHCHVIGPTGTGKSTLLARLAVQDLEAGRGLVVIDPKGDLVTSILDRVPEQRRNDVILLDPTDDHRPVGLNLLAGAEAAPERVADEVVGLFRRLFASSWGPRTADVLHASLLTLTATPGMTLCELPALLVDDAFRHRLVAAVKDPILLGFWAWYEQLSPGERVQAIGPVMNKLRAFLLRRRLRLMLGQAQPGWAIEDVLDRRKVLLVNLARGELGSEAAALVGSLVVASLWRAIQRRAVRLPVMVTVDEFQDVINLDTDLGEVLAQARGFGVGMTLAHQHLGQLGTELKSAVLANARTKIVFQAAADDATVLARQLGSGLSGLDVMSLPRHEAYVAACVDGRVLPAASLRTEALPPGLGSARAIRTASRDRFGCDSATVEAAMVERQTVADRGTVGRRLRRTRAEGSS
jgi:hypothetical protein